MPIRPEEKARYPKNWKAVSLEVRAAAGWRCEGSPAYPDCRAVNAEPHPVTGSKVVLTVAHLNHQPEDCGEPGNRPNLKAWCQRCHLTYDAPVHAMNAAITRAANRGQPDMFNPRESQKERAARYRKKLHEAKYGVGAGDQRGKRQRHPSGPEHKNWGDGRMVTSDGYVSLRVGKDHPLANPEGWAYEHLVIWVAAGNPRPPKGMTLHHINEHKDDNRIQNLELKSKTRHSAEHMAERERDDLGRVVQQSTELTA